MRLLLDSHVRLWWLDDHPSLGPQCREDLGLADEVFFSAVTPWELGIERALGKIVIPDGLADALTAAGFTALPITVAQEKGHLRQIAHRCGAGSAASGPTRGAGDRLVGRVVATEATDVHLAGPAGSPVVQPPEGRHG